MLHIASQTVRQTGHWFGWFGWPCMYLLLGGSIASIDSRNESMLALSSGCTA
jgi:hypothetical protein